MPNEEGARNGKRDFTTIAISWRTKRWIDSIKFSDGMTYDEVLDNIREALRSYRVLPGGQLVKNGA